MRIVTVFFQALEQFDDDLQLALAESGSYEKYRLQYIQKTKIRQIQKQQKSSQCVVETHDTHSISFEESTIMNDTESGDAVIFAEGSGSGTQTCSANLASKTTEKMWLPALEVDRDQFIGVMLQLGLGHHSAEMKLLVRSPVWGCLLNVMYCCCLPRAIISCS